MAIDKPGLGLNLIKSRSHFFALLKDAIEQTERYVIAEPNWTAADGYLSQLCHMRHTTADGRKPTHEERKRVDLGRQAYREFEGAGGEHASYGVKLQELSMYYQYWLSDGLLTTFDWDQDWAGKPDKFDFSDEPDTPGR